jgi:hypothetical protein
VNSALLARTVHRFCIYIRLAAACNGVLNSSVSCRTTHTGAGHTGAEHYNRRHGLLIGVIIAAIPDLSMQINESFSAGCANDSQNDSADFYISTLSSSWPESQ